MKSPWRKTQVRPPKVKFGRRTCMRFGGTLGPESMSEGSSGSAAESEVRPPNMERLRERLWPPKVLFERAKVRPPKVKFGRRTCMSLGGTLGCRRSLTRPPIKGPQIGNG